MRQVSGVEDVKAILVLNPAEPPVMMRTTVTLAAESTDLLQMRAELFLIVKKIQEYVPGYKLVVEPYAPALGMVSATVKVSGAGYYLPSYAGNLDIINAAAVETAKRHMQSLQTQGLETVS
jgi:acetaldehyde dehydrogenase